MGSRASARAHRRCCSISRKASPALSLSLSFSQSALPSESGLDITGANTGREGGREIEREPYSTQQRRSRSRSLLRPSTARIARLQHGPWAALYLSRRRRRPLPSFLPSFPLSLSLSPSSRFNAAAAINDMSDLGREGERESGTSRPKPPPVRTASQPSGQPAVRRWV